MIAFENENLILELVAEAQQGDAHSLNELAQRVRPRIRSYYLRAALDVDLAEDLTQDTMLHMVRSIKKLNKVESFWPWLYQIASRQMKNHFRRKTPANMVSLSSIQESCLPSTHHQLQYQPDRPLEVKESASLIYKAITKLKKRTRDIVTKRYFKGQSYAEIGAEVGCSEAAARASYSRAKETIRRYVRKHE